MTNTEIQTQDELTDFIRNYCEFEFIQVDGDVFGVVLSDIEFPCPKTLVATRIEYGADIYDLRY